MICAYLSSVVYNIKKSENVVIIIVNISTINICVGFIFCTSSFCFISHTPPGQCFACPGYIVLYILHPMHIPNDVSKNSSIRQKKHIARFIIPLTSKTTSEKNMISDKRNPMLHANLFCGAPTHSTS